MAKTTAQIESRPDHPELFISYAGPDVARAEALYRRLTDVGFTVWFDRARFEPASDWHAEIKAGRDAARVILPLITPHWKHSPWTREETYGHHAIVPVIAEGKPKEVLTPPLLGKQAVELDPLAKGDKAVWEKLFARLWKLVENPPPDPTERLVQLPFPANPYFTGRKDDLLRIHEQLHEAPVAALTQSHVHAIAAMGGVGKTTLANEYARQYWRLYPQILWVDARRGYQSEFALLFDLLFPEHAGPGIEPEEKAKHALAELNGASERLLIIDNVEDDASVRPWLPRAATTGCHTLITSRYTGWRREAGIHVIPLDIWTSEAARAFLIDRTDRPAEGAELRACDDLAKALGYLPLALEQAGAYIAAPGAGVTYADYLRLYRDAHEELLSRGVLGSTDYPDPVITTWKATIEKLSPESHAVLRLCAWYADTPIPRSLVIEGSKEVLALAEALGPVVPLAGANAAEFRMRDALAGLDRYSMVLDLTGETFRVHGLVQTVERLEAKRVDADGVSRRLALARLTEAFPYAYREPALWPLCRQLLPHQAALGGRLDGDGEEAIHAFLLNLCGSFLEGGGDEKVALPYYERALESSERVLGPDHQWTLTSLNNLAVCMQFLGDAKAALALNQRALDSRERVLGPDHADTLTSVDTLAGCLTTLGDAKAALPLYQRSLEGRERVLGPDHHRTLTSMNNLAYCLMDLGDATAAQSLNNRALEISERVLGPNHPDTLTSANNVAAGLLAQGDAKAALALVQRVANTAERVLGPEHPTTLQYRANLEVCAKELGQPPG